MGRESFSRFRWSVELPGYCWHELDGEEVQRIVRYRPLGIRTQQPVEVREKIRKRTAHSVFGTPVIVRLENVDHQKTGRSATGCWVLKRKEQRSFGVGERVYSPMEEPALYRHFADTELNSEAILKFANNWGMLGSFRVGIDFPFLRTSPPEFLDFWLSEIASMRLAISLWDCLRRQDFKRLRKLIKIESASKEEPCVVVSQEGLENISLKLSNVLKSVVPPVQERVRNITNPRFISRAVRRADALLSTEVQRFVEEHFGIVGPGAKMRLGKELLSAITVSILEELINVGLREELSQNVFSVDVTSIASGFGRGVKFSTEWCPKSLIGALWLQFARSIEVGAEYRRCVVCGKWFELVTREVKRTRLYCSSACRFKQYRERQKSAVEAYVAGRAVDDIARELGTDTETVRKWIARGAELRPEDQG